MYQNNFIGKKGINPQRKIKIYDIIYLFMIVFTYLRERMHTHKWEEGQREGERDKQTPTELGTNAGLHPRTMRS